MGNMTDDGRGRKTVLFCGPIDSPLNSGRYMAAAMEGLGYRVIEYDYRTNPRFEQDVPGIVEREKPTYVVTLKGEKLSPVLVEKFRRAGCVTILWFTMIPLEDWMTPLALAHDFVCTNVEDHVEFFQRCGVRHVKWVHQGFAPAFFGIGESGEDTPRQFHADVAMIGSMGAPIYRTRCEMVMRLRREGIAVSWWGPRLSRQLKNLPYFLGGVHRAWAGREVYMREFAGVVRGTGIFIGQDADLPVRGRYLSNRSLAVPGCGGFYLCRRTPGIEDAFRVGEEVAVFDTPDEMVEKVGYYLGNESERRRIALAGQQRVLADYTYETQMGKIFAWVDSCHLMNA